MALSDNGAVRKNGASVDCENVTFTNNTADKGGAIGIPYDCVTSLSCSLNLTDCTFAGNQAAEGSDIYSVSEAGITIKQTEKPDPKPNPDPDPADPKPPSPLIRLRRRPRQSPISSRLATRAISPSGARWP